MNNNKKEVIIIGAGPAGLTAGYELISKASDKFNVTILESSDCLGGISKTVNYKGNRMDIGGHRFYSKIPGINEWWSKFMPMQGSPSSDDIELNRKCKIKEGGPDPNTSDNVMLYRNRVSRIYYDGKFYDYPISFNLKNLKNFGFSNSVKVVFSYLQSQIHRLPENNLENFYINRFGKKLYRMFFESYTQTVWGVHPSNIDASWGKQRVKGISITAIIKNAFSRLFRRNMPTEDSLIDEFKYPKLGPGQLWEIVCQKYTQLGGKLLMLSTVKGLHKVDNVLDSVIFIKNDEICSLKADYVISSMPLKDLLSGIDDTPKSVLEVSNNLIYRDYITIGVLVSKLKIKNYTSIKTISGIIPDCWIYIQDKKVKMGRLQIYNNWSPYLVDDLHNTVWLGLEYFVNEGDKYWQMSDSDFSKFAIKELIEVGYIKTERDVKDFHIERVKKAYPAYFGSYKNIGVVKRYLESIENLYCVGRNGQHRYNNLDLSMFSALIASDEIIDGKQQDMNWC